MIDNERLGHLIRKIRMKANAYSVTKVEVYRDEMLRILNAADLGLVLSVEGPLKALEASKQLKLKNDDYNVLVAIQKIERAAYKKDLERFLDLGFKDLEAVLTWFQDKGFSRLKKVLHPEIPAKEIDVKTKEDLPF